MDATRRSFDDIDGCGGPPQGELVALEHRRGPRRGRGRSGGGGARAAGPDAFGTAAAAAGAGFGGALATVVVATLVALAVIVATGRDALDALLTADPMGTLRTYAGPIILAGGAFEAVLAGGLALATRTNPFAAVRGITREEVFRGFLTFLLALFAWTFFVSAVDGPLGGRHWWPSAVGGLFVAEVLLTVVVAPVLEERLFRGLLLTGLRDRFGPVVGVLGQAAIYGAAHVWALRDASRTGTVVGMAAVGAVFGWMAHATKDLKPVILAHAMFGAWVLAERIFGF